MDDQCHAIVPFWWIAKLATANLLVEPHEVRFERCLICTETLANKFDIRYDLDIADHREAMVIGSILISQERVNPIS
jgi:hypothetical protein